MSEPELISYIEQMLDYERAHRLNGNYRSGFSSLESGPCCPKCRLKGKPRTPLNDLVGCRNPFQIPEQYGKKLCQCHIPFRKVAVQTKIATLEQILWHVKHRKGAQAA